MACFRSLGSDIEEGIALARQLFTRNSNGTNPDVSAQIQRGQPSTSFYDTKVGKGLLQVAYIVPTIWCANKMLMDPLFLYLYVIDDDNKCVKLDKFTLTSARIVNMLGTVINVVSLCSLVMIMKMGLYKKRFEKIIWFLLLLIDLWSYLASYLPPIAPSQLVMSVVWPNPEGLNFYSASVFLVEYFGTVSLMYITFIRATKLSATLTKATWAKVAFNLLLYLHGGHVFGSLWYVFAIAKEIDCWTQACKNYASSKRGPNAFWCGGYVGNGTDYIILNKMCPTKTRKRIIYDFGIYYDALESGIVEMSNNLPKRILYCLRWGLQNLSGFGQNLQGSTDAWENILVISFTIYGVLLFVFFIGNMQIHLQLSTQRSEKIRQKKNEIEKSKSFAKLPKNLQKQIKRYQPDEWEETKDVHFENLFNNVPDTIKKNIKHKLCLEIVKKVEEFRSWSDEMLDELCDYAKPVSYTQYAQIIRKGSSIDEMLFFVHGKLQTYSLTNVNIGTASTNVSTSATGSKSTTHWRISIDHLEDGMFCGGELVDWFRVDPYSSNLPISTRTIQTLTKVDAFALMSYDLQNLFIKHCAASASTQNQAPPVESQPHTPVESQP